MKVHLIQSTNSQTVGAKIIPPGDIPLPSLTEGWRFNFRKHSRLPGAEVWSTAVRRNDDAYHSTGSRRKIN